MMCHGLVPEQHYQPNESSVANVLCQFISQNGILLLHGPSSDSLGGTGSELRTEISSVLRLLLDSGAKGKRRPQFPLGNDIK